MYMYMYGGIIFRIIGTDLHISGISIEHNSSLRLSEVRVWLRYGKCLPKQPTIQYTIMTASYIPSSMMIL